MGWAIASAAFSFCTAGFIGYAVSFLTGVVVADFAQINCVAGGCGGFARSVATVGGSLAAVWGALAGFYRGLPRPGFSSGSARR